VGLGVNPGIGNFLDFGRVRSHPNFYLIIAEWGFHGLKIKTNNLKINLSRPSL